MVAHSPLEHGKIAGKALLRSYDFRQILASVGVRFAALPASFVVGILLARLLGPGDLGYYSFLVTLSLLLATPMFAGWTQFLTREVATARAADNLGAVKGLWQATYILTFAYSLLLLLVGAVAVWLGMIAANDLIYGVILSGAYPLAANLGAVTRALGWRILGQVPDAIGRPIFFIVLIGIYLLTGKVLGAHEALLFQALAVAGAAAFAWVLLRLQVRRFVGYTSRSVLVSPGVWARAFGPLLLIALAGAVTTHLSLLLTGVLASHEQTGYYRVAQQTASLAGIGLAGVQAWVMPVLAQAQASADRRLLQRSIRKAQLASLAFALPVVVIVGTFAGDVQAMIFGADFAGSGPALRLLLANEVVLCVFVLYHHSLVMSAGAHRALPGLTLCIALNLILSLVLIPSFGATGAAVAGSTSTLGWMLVSFAMYRRQQSRNTLSQNE